MALSNPNITQGTPIATKRTAARALRGVLLLAIFVAPLHRAVARDFFIHDGDRVVFLGDSITQQQFYTNYIEAYALSRHPSWNLTFRNVGWGGDTSWLRQRQHINETLLFASDDKTQLEMVTPPIQFGLDRDVFPLRPTVVTVDFGMNDFAYQALRPDILRAYIQSETQIARMLRSGGARPVFLTTQPIEEKRPDPDQDIKNISLRKFADALKAMTERENIEFADQFDPYMQAMVNSRSTIGGGDDSVHPGPAGHTIMAWAILKALGATPLVSTAAINAQDRSVGATQACSISNLKVEGVVVTFDRTDEALPMPVDAKAEAVLNLVPITHDLNEYELKIEGLSAGRYTVTIDGEVAATVTASELGGGWNLAYKAGPITRQSNELLAMVAKKNSLYFERWRNVQLFNDPDWAAKNSDIESRRKAELVRLDAEISSLEVKINAARQPKQRHFIVAPEIVPSE
jgi:lysophospholipase L1-like esterase